MKLRSVQRLLALGVALAGLAVTGPAVVAPVSPVAAPATTASDDCATADLQRVRVGSKAHDPNRVSQAEVLDASSAATSRQRRLPSFTKVKIARPTTKIDVPVWVHVITGRASDGTTLGAVSASTIRSQISWLNTAYDSSYFSFTLAGTTTTSNNSWYSWDEDATDAPAKKLLHRGDATTLNIYLTRFANEGILGYATFPWSNAGKQDGVVIANGTLPGGSTTGYNQGDTAVHEVGHWLGLFHTFQNGCSLINDAVNDTPAQKDGDNVNYCVRGTDTCPAAGADPGNNYMSYGNDVCLTQFTPGQGYRMRLLWYTSRVQATT